MRISRDQMLMEMAITASKRGTCLRRKIGAVIAVEGRVISIGYVGAPSGFPHCTPETCSPGNPCNNTVHAESNAIAAAARAGIATLSARMYTTVSPCLKCAQLIIASGIIAVDYLEEYRDIEPVEYLRKAGIFCDKLLFQMEL